MQPQASFLTSKRRWRGILIMVLYIGARGAAAFGSASGKRFPLLFVRNGECRRMAWTRRRYSHRNKSLPRFLSHPSIHTTTTTTSISMSGQHNHNHNHNNDNDNEAFIPPWSNSTLTSTSTSTKTFRARQHVNPLSRKFQLPSNLPPDWPTKDVFSNVSLPLCLDIGCGRGGFLLHLATWKSGELSLQEKLEFLRGRIKEEELSTTTTTTPFTTPSSTSTDSSSSMIPDLENTVLSPYPNLNYLGLEIRPSIVQHAQHRIANWNLSGQVAFWGCNANVDLHRLLLGYQTQHFVSLPLEESHQRALPLLPLRVVTIQFPDPHFKARHAKRRVVTTDLVQTLAEYMSEGAVVVLASDVRRVLDEMRVVFADVGGAYFFDDWKEAGDAQDADAARAGDPDGGESESDTRKPRKRQAQRAKGGGEEGYVSPYPLESYTKSNPLGVPTEREVSVVQRGLPVYRCVFWRNHLGVVKKDEDDDDDDDDNDDDDDVDRLEERP